MPKRRAGHTLGLVLLGSILLSALPLLASEIETDRRKAVPIPRNLKIKKQIENPGYWIKKADLERLKKLEQILGID